MVTVAQLDTKFTTSGDADVSGKLNSLGQQVDAVGSKSSDAAGKTGALGTALGAMGTAAITGFIGGVSAASNFQFQMSAVQAVTGATQAQMKGLSDQALDLSKNSIFSAQQVGVAQEEMAKAGLTVNDMMAGATEAVIQLAHATGGDLGQAATIAANALNQFGLSGADAGHVADVLTNAANTSALDVSDLGESLKYAAPAAHALGIGIEDTTAALSVMADAGLRGSRAGTDLKDVLLALAGPTTTQAAGLQQMGIQAFDANGKFVGLGNVIKQVADATKNMTDQQRLAILEQAFGKQGAQAMIDLLNSQTDAAKKAGKSWGDYVRNMNVSGSAAKQAATRLDNFQGSLLKLKQTLTVLGIQLGSVLLGPMKAIVDAIRTMLNAFLSLPQGMQETIAAIGLVLSAFLALKSGFGGLLPILGKISPGFAQMGESLAGLAPVLLGVAAAAGVFYLAYRTNFLGIGDETRKVVGQVKLGLGTFGTYFDAARKSGMDPFNASLRALAFSAIDAFGPSSFIAKGALQVEHLGKYFTDVFKSGNTLTKSLNALPKSMRGVARGFGILVDSAHDLNAAFDRAGLLGVLHQLPFEFNDLFQALGNVVGAVPGLASVGNALINFGLTLDGVWHDIGTVVMQFVELRTNGFGIIEAAVIALSDNFPILTDAFHTLGDATTNYVNAVKALMDAFGQFAKGDYGAMFQDLKTAAVDALSGMGDAALAVGQAILAGIGAIPWGTVTDLLRTGALAALNAIGQLAGWVLDVGAPALFGWILDAASWLGGKILDAVKAVAPVLSGWLLNVAAPTLFGWTLEAASWLGGKILDAVKSVAPKLEGWTLNVGAPALGGWVLSAASWLGSELRKYLPLGLSSLISLDKWELTVAAPKLIGWIDGAANWLITNIRLGLLNVAVDFGGWALNLLAPIVKSGFGSLASYVQQWVDGQAQGINPQLQQVNVSINKFVANNTDPQIAQLNTDLGQKLSNLQVDVSQSAVNIHNWIAGKLPDVGPFMKSLGPWFSGVQVDVSQVGVNIHNWIVGNLPDAVRFINSLGPWFSNAQVSLNSSAVNIHNWVKGELPDAVGFIDSLGNWFNGTTVKINQTAVDIHNWVKGAVPSIFDAIESWLPIDPHIPYDVFLDVIPHINIPNPITAIENALGIGSNNAGAAPTTKGNEGNTLPNVGGVGGAGGGFTFPGNSRGGIGLGSLPFGQGAGGQQGQGIQPPDFSAFIAAFAAAGQQAAAALGAGLQTALTAVASVRDAIVVVANDLTVSLSASALAAGQAWAINLGAGLQLGLTATVAVTAAITAILAGWAAATTASGIAAGSGWAVGLGAGLQRGLSATVATAAAITGSLLALAGSAAAAGSSAGASWANGLGAGLQRGLGAASATAGAIEGILYGLAGAASGAGSSAGYGFAYGLGGGLNEALGTAAAVAGGIAGILSIDLSGEGANAGYSFAAGLASAAGAAYGAAAAIAAAAVAGASTALGIASPSKVFRNLADQTVEGYLIPLQQRRGEVADSMSALLQAPRTSATDGVLLQTLSRSQAQSSQPTQVNVYAVLNADDFHRVMTATDATFTMIDPSEMRAITTRAR